MKGIASVGEARALMFRNFCNGVPKRDIADVFSRSVEEVTKDIAFVALKIREYRHLRCLNPHPAQGMLPHIACETEEDILANKGPLLWTLQFLGPEYLTSDLTIPTLTMHTVDKASHLVEAARGVRAHVSRAA